MKTLLTTSIIWGIVLSCNTKDCPNMPDKFSSINEAITTIRNTKDFSIDSIEINEVNHVRKADYFTCNGKVGYIIYSFKDDLEEHFFSQVPIEVWNDFKKSPDKDSFLNNQLVGKYFSTTIYNTDTK